MDSMDYLHHIVVYGCEGTTDPSPNAFSHVESD